MFFSFWNLIGNKLWCTCAREQSGHRLRCRISHSSQVLGAWYCLSLIAPASILTVWSLLAAASAAPGPRCWRRSSKSFTFCCAAVKQCYKVVRINLGSLRYPGVCGKLPGFLWFGPDFFCDLVHVQSVVELFAKCLLNHKRQQSQKPRFSPGFLPRFCPDFSKNEPRWRIS